MLRHIRPIACLFVAALLPPAASAQEAPDQHLYVGVVQNGYLESLRQGRVYRLTEASIVAGHSPEVGEIELANFEGRVIVVTGRDNGEWIYSSEILEVGEPALSDVIIRLATELGSCRLDEEVRQTLDRWVQ